MAHSSSADPVKARLNQLIRAHNAHLEESKRHASGTTALDVTVRNFMHDQFEEIEALQTRVYALEQLVRTLARDLLSVLEAATHPTTTQPTS